MNKKNENETKGNDSIKQSSKQKPKSMQLPDNLNENGILLQTLEQQLNQEKQQDSLEDDEDDVEKEEEQKVPHSQGDLNLMKKEKKRIIKNQFINYPVIAILSQPSGHEKYSKEKYSYIYTSYVQYFQQSGIRVIPLKWTESEDNLIKVMNKVNGLVLTGGGTNLMMRRNEQSEKEFTQFSNVGLFLINIAKQKNEQGIYFPIWGTCLGFELMFLYFAQQEIRNIFDSKNHFAKQIFNYEHKEKNRMLNTLLKPQLKSLEEEAFFFYNHKNAISKKSYLSNQKLNQNFNCLAYTKDLKGKTFISIAEGKTLPFYGTQFHPEKLQFEHPTQYQKQPTVNQLKIAQHFSNFFYSECLKNNQRFETLSEQQELFIENYQPIYLQNYEQGMYLFNNQGEEEFKIKTQSINNLSSL